VEDGTAVSVGAAVSDETAVCEVETTPAQEVRRSAKAAPAMMRLMCVLRVGVMRPNYASGWLIAEAIHEFVCLLSDIIPGFAPGDGA
jgi:hypothetical protein